jgi:hypothetical protein
MGVAIQPPFTEAQIELLSLFKVKLNQSDMQELRQLLLEFKFRKLQENIEQITEGKGYTEQDFDNMKQEHNRTSYKSYRKHLQNKTL